MSSNQMTDRLEDFRCPVCRARQILQPECRRCHADLSLVVKAQQRARYLYLALLQARQDNDFTAEQQLSSELRLLRPAMLR